MRLFVALDIDDSIRGRLVRFLEGVRGFAPDVRWIKPESMHITLKFIGEKSEADAEQIKHALATISAESVNMTIRGYGFFPGLRMPRVFWIGIEAGPELASLAGMVDHKLASLNIAQEEHAFSPHLTLARGGRRSGSPRKEKGDGNNRDFQRLQEKLAAMPTPEFGTMTAREFFLYQSLLSPAGSRYTKSADFTLR